MTDVFHTILSTKYYVDGFQHLVLFQNAYSLPCWPRLSPLAGAMGPSLMVDRADGSPRVLYGLTPHHSIYITTFIA